MIQITRTLSIPSEVKGVKIGSFLVLVSTNTATVSSTTLVNEIHSWKIIRMNWASIFRQMLIVDGLF